MFIERIRDKSILRLSRTILRGVLFGLLFPIISTIVEIISTGLPFSVSTIIEIHTVTPLLWVIDTAPIFLGLMAWYTGWQLEAIKKSNELTTEDGKYRLNQILDMLPLGVFVLDEHGKPFYANSKSLEILGQGIVAGAGMNELSEIYSVYIAGTDTLYPTEDLPVVRASRGESSQIDDLEIQKNGARVLLEVTGRPIYDSNGKIRFSVAVFKDITSRKLLEKEASESRSFLDSIVENIPDMVFIKDAKELKFVRINKAGEDLLGVSRHELLGKSDFDFFPKEQAEFFTSKDREVFVEKTLKDIPEEPINTRNHGKRILHTKKVPVFDQSGNPLYLLGISEDITLIKQAELKIEQHLRELERANLNLDQFAYVVSHDLKTPLRGISNLTEWIEEDMGGNIKPEVKKHIVLLKQRVQRMESLIQGILEYSRSGGKKGSPERIDTQILVAEIVDMLSPKKGINVEIIPTFPVLHTDRTMITQVFSNLLSNAFKFLEGGKGSVVISSKVTGGLAEFSIRDSGPGIPQELHERIFSLFHRVDPNDGVEGTGIGLAIVKKIVDEQGGKVWLHSAEGKGADFRFTWPLNMLKPIIEG